MAVTSNTALRVTELDFDTIKENLKAFLNSQSEFQDYDFEGSGMSVLLDVLAYNTHYMGYYINMAANEMFLDSAQLRSSVLSHAKAIGYVPSSAVGAKSNVSIVVTPSVTEDNSTNTLTLDRYVRFLGEDIDGVNYPFVTLYSNTVSKSNGTFTFNGIKIGQGDVVTLQYTMDDGANPKRRFQIPSANVDLTTLTITVQESTTNTSSKEYVRYSDLTELKSDSEVYFVEEDETLNYTFSFGDGVIGKKPKNGNIIIATYLDTVGSVANSISRFTIQQPINGFSDNVVVTAANSSYGGTDKETIEQTRFRAPYNYAVQNRAVTKNDYESLILKDYNNIDAVSVWGGEENVPPIYGKVYLSLKTKGNYALSNLEKENIKQELIRTRNILTVIPEIVDPDYTFIRIRGNVTYNPSLTSKAANEIEQLVRAAIQDYNDDELNTFSSIFRKSKLQSYIEAADPSITGSDIRILFMKKEYIEVNKSRNYIFNYNMPLRKGSFAYKLDSFPQITVLDLENLSRDVYFEEVPESFTGVDSIVVQNAGINYSGIPTVTIRGDGMGATARAIVVNSKIERIEIINKGSNYTRATVEISGGGGSQAVAIAKLESRLGDLRTYYFKSNGEKSVVNANAGTIDYDTGLITLTSLYATGVVENSIYPTDYLTIEVPAEQEIIKPSRNRILTIDYNDPTSIQVSMVAES